MHFQYGRLEMDFHVGKYVHICVYNDNAAGVIMCAL